jgi:hypothetical protein
MVTAYTTALPAFGLAPVGATLAVIGVRVVFAGLLAGIATLVGVALQRVLASPVCRRPPLRVVPAGAASSASPNAA